jgi:hypothetical protein
MSVSNSIRIIGRMNTDPQMEDKGQDANLPVSKVSVAVDRYLSGLHFLDRPPER